MSGCEHIAWVNLTGKEHLHLHYTGRVSRLLAEIPEPRLQYPSTIFFLGKRARDIALRQIFPRNNLRRSQKHGTINLRLDSSTFSAEYPIFFADSDPLAPILSSLGTSQCHENISQPLRWNSPSELKALGTIYCRLIFPFTDIVCIFADDVGGLEAVAAMLRQWIDAGVSSNLAANVRPRLVIVITEEEHSSTGTVLGLADLRLLLNQDDGANKNAVFSSLLVLQLAHDSISQLARHRRLKEVLFQELDALRLLRIQHRTLFSAIHVDGFFCKALVHVSLMCREPFDFIGSSRADSQITSAFEEHLCDFLHLGRRRFVTYTALASYIASCLLMESFPPKMHSTDMLPSIQWLLLTSHAEFEPKDVYRQLYRQFCISALSKVYCSQTLAEAYSNYIEDSMEEQFQSIDCGFETGPERHANNLKDDFQLWAPLKSHKTCLFCIHRSPETVLSCEHAICDKCIRIFGTVRGDGDTYHEIAACLQCVHKGQAKVKIKPATAGARILSIDGGGVRGVIPLEFLKLLQDQLGPDLPLDHLFEQAFGTSSGMAYQVTFIPFSETTNPKIRWINYPRVVFEALEYLRLYQNVRSPHTPIIWGAPWPRAKFVGALARLPTVLA